MPPIAVTITLGEAEQAALDRYIRETNAALTRTQALAAIVSEWALAHAGEAGDRPDIDEGMRPNELNASNDI